ncbi:MAG TPA: cytochrome P450 [Candidatus Binatia bacterium]|jgi:cytochrome P450|nr:cytochrome P450 [Candidatus Binatia bacterium]
MSEPSWYGAEMFDPAFRDDPYPYLKRLREEAPPVHLTPVGMWRITRYADVERLLFDSPVGVRTTEGVIPGLDESLTGPREFMLQQDPPTHSRLRKLVSRAFTPRAINQIRADIQRIVDGCLDKVAAQGHMDVVADLALPVPSTMICEMMGVPLEDREKFTEWTAKATHGLASQFLTPEMLAETQAAAMQLVGYFQGLIEERRHALSDDILSELIRAEEAGDRLSPTELLSQAIGLLIAGFETTIGLISNGTRALVRHPDQLALLRENPALIETAVEECLRFDGPIILTVRVVHEDVEIGGTVIPKDGRIWAMLASANRDASVFANADQLDITRQPNPHLAFGGGPHYCLGAFLARTEAQLAIGGLVQRFRDLALPEPTVTWGLSLFRVPGRLPLTFRA